jgi:23S rRNA pseudouridine1911/1915/1917 synthase
LGAFFSHYGVRVQLLEIIHEDDDLLVVNKPPGLVCHPTKTDEYSSLIGRVRLYVGSGSPPQLVNRLDRETSGLVMLAKNSEAARQLRRIWEDRRVEKDYFALVHGHVREEHGVIDAPLGKDEQSRVVIKDRVRPDGAAAQTEFWVEDGTAMGEGNRVCPDPLPSPTSLLRVRPHTGRKHQIRIHLAHIGHPIIGDKLYGGDEDLYLALVENRLTAEQRERLVLPHHALHAWRVRFVWREKTVLFEAPLPGWLRFC